MEIDKVLFGTLTSKGITGDFETYDVNADGKINEEDAALAPNNALSNQIRAMLNSADEEAELAENADLDMDALELEYGSSALTRAGATQDTDDTTEVNKPDEADEADDVGGADEQAEVNTPKDTTGTTEASKSGAAKTDADKTQAVQDILSKYPIGTATGTVDDYSMDNPALVAFKQAVDGGILTQLANQGFTQSDIIDIISQAYPSVHITNNSTGGYTCPYGHGEAAHNFYASFIEKIKSLPNATVKNLQTELDTLNSKINQNNSKLEKLNGTIDKLEKEIEEAITTAINSSTNIQEAQKEEASKIIREELAKYSIARGEITYDEFKDNVAARLDAVTASGQAQLSNIVSNLIASERKMDSLSGYIDELKTLSTLNATLGTQAAAKETELANALNNSNNNDPGRCDPIGFSVDGTRYDFFVDKDNNGNITNETEFLGAQDGWSEMTALDTDHDGKVSVAEMANIKIVVTAADGTQTVKSAAEIFASDDNVDLNSYLTMNQDFENGNTLLGSYSLTMNGQQVNDGYNTMDTLTWLDDNYNFTDEDEGKNRFSQGNTKAVAAKDYSSQATVFEIDYNNKTVKLGQAWEKVGATRDTVMTGIISERAKQEAQSKARVLDGIFKRTNNNDN